MGRASLLGYTVQHRYSIDFIRDEDEEPVRCTFCFLVSLKKIASPVAIYRYRIYSVGDLSDNAHDKIWRSSSKRLEDSSSAKEECQLLFLLYIIPAHTYGSWIIRYWNERNLKVLV